MLPKSMRVALLERTVAVLDTLARRRGNKSAPAHLEIGLRGEDAAFFHLLRKGYTVVARRWSAGHVRGGVVVTRSVPLLDLDEQGGAELLDRRGAALENLKLRSLDIDLDEVQPGHPGADLVERPDVDVHPDLIGELAVRSEPVTLRIQE